MRRSITLDRAQTKRLVYLASQDGIYMVPLAGKSYTLRAKIEIAFTADGAILAYEDRLVTQLALRQLM